MVGKFGHWKMELDHLAKRITTYRDVGIVRIRLKPNFVHEFRVVLVWSLNAHIFVVDSNLQTFYFIVSMYLT